jgi:hypothetical protein
MNDLQDQLRALGRALNAGVRDDLADAVQARIAALPPDRRTGRAAARTPRWRRWVAAIAALLAAVAVSAAVSAPVRAAITHVFRFGGVEVRPGPGPTPLASPTLPGEHATDLDSAGREVGFRVRTPARLPPPDAVTVSDKRVVSLYYSRPSGPVRIDEFSGDVDHVMWDKYVAVGMAQRVTVAGHDALWFEDPSVLQYVLPDGEPDPGSARRTHGALVWSDGGVTYRIDGIRPLADAIAVAASMR